MDELEGERQALSPADFAARMAAIRDRTDDDPEMAHVDADDLLCDVLRSLGYGEGVEIFENLERWYA